MTRAGVSGWRPADVESAAEAVEALETAVAALAGLDLSNLHSGDAVEAYVRLHAASDRLAALSASVLPAVQADGLWALDGSRSFPHWVARRTGQSVAAARRAVRLGTALRDELPVTAAAAIGGTIGLEQAQVMTRVAATSPARLEALADPASPCNEAFLVRQAELLPVETFGRLARRWAAAADPEADERGFRDAQEREFLSLAQTAGGYHLVGFLTEEHGQCLHGALTSLAGPPVGEDRRTPGQRRAAALAELARTALDRGETGAGAAVRPHLNVHVAYETLVRLCADRSDVRAGDHDYVTAGNVCPEPYDPEAVAGADGAGQGRPAAFPWPAEFQDGSPVPPSLLAVLACDSEVTRIVFGPAGEVLDVGRAERTVTGPRRRAVIARDRTCRYPGCDVEPDRCDVHHPHHWAAGGATSVANGILLCRHHHTHVHQRGIRIRWGPAGWQFGGDGGAIGEEAADP